MRITRRRLLVAVSMLMAVLGTGCSPGSLYYFLMNPDNHVEATVKKIAPEDKKQEFKVLIMTYNSGLETRRELIQADRQLAELIAKHLKEQCETNKEKISIVPPRKVEDYKNNHPDWQQDLDLRQAARYFKADYVVYVEINSISLFDKGSANELYRGRADVKVSLTDVKKPDDSPEYKEFSHMYPGETKGPVPVGDITTGEFRTAFLATLAKKVAWCFTAHPAMSDYDVQ